LVHPLADLVESATHVTTAGSPCKDHSKTPEAAVLTPPLVWSSPPTIAYEGLFPSGMKEQLIKLRAFPAYSAVQFS
jgi:hypothetical protein